MLVMRREATKLPPVESAYPTSSSITSSGRRNLGIWLRIMPPARESESNTTTS